MTTYLKWFCLVTMLLWAVPEVITMAVCPEGDINNDCVVDLYDFAILADQWLDPDGAANIDGQAGVNAGDLLVMADSWLDKQEYVIISEIAASNSGSFTDEDGDSSDWIELFNPTRKAVNLHGWSLINDKEGVVNWLIPSIEIGPNEFIVIFASGKDRRNPAGALHTNFKLDADGEYLALVKDDGMSVVFSYDPDYGVQYPDVSFGISQHAEPTVLAGPNSLGKLLVPDAVDDQQTGSSWIGESFDDSVWHDVTFGVGFDTRNSSAANENMAFGKTATQSSEWGGYPATNATDGALNNFTHTAIGDLSPWWKIDLEETFFINEIVMYNRTSCCQERLYNITIEVFDLNDVLVYISEVLNPVLEGSTPVSPGESLTLDLDNLPAGGVSGQYIRISKTFVTGTAEYLTLAEVEVFGVESYADSIESNIESEMKGINSSCYLRIPFEVTDVLGIDTAILRMKYDDGFAAYLNGSLIASSNVPAGAIAFDAEATATHLAEVSEEFRVSPGLLRSGNNVLAIHGLNYTADNESFLVIPELEVYKVGSGDEVYFVTPTPGEINGQGVVGFVSDTTFDIDRGFYDDPFDVHITTKTPGASIIYTTDGSVPALTNGVQVAAPDGDSIPVATVSISATTVLRAVAFKDMYYPSNTDTHTYIFLDDVVNQPVNPAGFPNMWASYGADYEMDPDVVNDPVDGPQLETALLSLSTISIVTDQDNLFDSTIGIYANSIMDGVAWERPASMEYFTPDGTKQYQVNCGLRIQGGYFRSNWATRKHSFRLLFKGIYGATKMEFPLFDPEEDAVTSFDTLVLRAGANDGYSWDAMGTTTQYTRDQFCRSLQRDTGQVASHGTFVHLYVNGLYWGLYNPVERPDGAFSSSYYGGDEEDWDVFKHKNMELNQGDRIALNQMLAKCQEAAGSNDAYQQLQGNNPDGSDNPAYPHLLDVDNYIDYMIVNIWGGNWDWPWNNYWLARKRTADSTGFKFYCWDIEDTIGSPRSPLSYNCIAQGNFSQQVGQYHANLKNNAEYRMAFADHIHKFFFNGGILESASLIQRYSDLADWIELSIIAESARWGDQHYSTPLGHSEWVGYRDWILNSYLTQRSDIVLNQMHAANLYPQVQAPAFNQHGGQVATGFEITMSAPTGTIYYTIDGSDPRLWGGAINSSAQIYAAGTGTQSTLISAGEMWSYLDNGSDQEAAWRQMSFNDASWASGNAELGYGDGGEQTVVGFIDVDPVQDDIQKNPTTYFRKSFSVSNASQFDSLSLSLLRDDGAIVCLNGTEIKRNNIPGGDVDYQTFASNAIGGGDESTFYDLGSVDTNLLIDGVNVLAVEIHQQNITSSDISFDIELTATAGGGSGGDVIVLDQSTQFKARVFDGGTWSALNEAVFAVGPVADDLRITEVMYHPAGDPNSEFIELKNIGAESINLNLVKFTNGVDFTFPAIDLAAGEFILVVKNTAAFNDQYPTFSGTIAGQFAGALDNDGDRVRLEDAIGTTIHDFKFKDGWYDITDGGGFTLTVSDPANATLYSEKDTWRASTNYGGSPGSDDIGPNPGDIVINELLAHSDTWPNDWVELYNTSGSEINISGWYLSDNNDDDPNLMKYRIAEGTTIAADGYIVFTQDEHFGSSFALSENGEKVCLTSVAGGVLTGYRETESFGASEVGVSLGRYYKASTDTYNFVAMSSITDGSANAYPKVGPIVISEIMYNPAAGGAYDNDEYEFVELYNVSGSAVTLEEYDAELNVTTAWKFTDGIDYVFDLGTTIGAGQRLVIARNIAAFAERYGYSAGVLGPFANDTKLSNGGERLQIGKPGDTDESGIRYYIRIDRVAYSDGSHPIGTDPWPTEADGGGDSLKRITLTNYGNDHVNWQASTASPGS